VARDLDPAGAGGEAGEVKNHPFAKWLAAAAACAALAGCASTNSVSNIVSVGENTFAITREAKTGFTRDTATLKEQALQDAARFCESKGKQLKVVSVEEHKPLFYTAGIANAKVVFKALDAGDPELMRTQPGDQVQPVVQAQPAVAVAAGKTTPTDELYSELVKLDELRKRGILTNEEFQAEKKKVLDRSK
jgi:2-keto-3-deoxy-6-phosphogluconate aldolase